MNFPLRYASWNWTWETAYNNLQPYAGRAGF